MVSGLKWAWSSPRTEGDGVRGGNPSLRNDVWGYTRSPTIIVRLLEADNGCM